LLTLNFPSRTVPIATTVGFSNDILGYITAGFSGRGVSPQNQGRLAQEVSQLVW
jgi:hypothetical protein